MNTGMGGEPGGAARRARAQRWRGFVVWFFVAVAVGGGAALIARAVDVRPVRIASNSMAPTIRRGDWIVVRDLGADGRQRIRRGDVVLLRFPLGTSGRAIKRVVALAGDRVTIAEHNVTVEGRAIRVAGAPSATARRRRSQTVRRGHVFVLGDNAAASIDSRSFGAVPATELVARELVVIAKPGRRLAVLLAALGLLACGVLLVARKRRRRTSTSAPPPPRRASEQPHRRPAARLRR